MMIKVSIIVPVYNSEKHLDKCLSSLMNQTLQDIQIIIVDDASTDKSEEIIAIYKEKYDHKITYIKKTNGGVGAARNVGIEYATGEYIGFVDADDYVETTMYEKLYNAAKRGNTDWVECNYFREYVDRPDKLKIKNVVYKTDDILIKTKFAVWNKIFKREIIQDNNIQFPLHLNYEDSEFVCKVVPYIHRVELVKEPLYHYVQHKSSRYKLYDEHVRDSFQIYKNILNYYKQHDFYRQYETQLEYLYIQSRLAASFLRILHIPDRKIRKIILKENWLDLVCQFPNWRKNKLLRDNMSLMGLYYKTINCFTYKIYSKIFRLLLFMLKL